METLNAGKKVGTQLWRVEKMELNPVPEELYGSFYTGDAYILLDTISVSNSYNVHSWVGNEATQDEMGAAAIFMVQIDGFLKGIPRQYSEFQGEESKVFQAYFKKSGLKYMKGGVASGFNQTPPENPKRLLHVKGRRTIRAIEVDMDWSSFNSGDCFIIDLGKNIYHWSGSNSNRFERLKTTTVASAIRDNERKGKANIHMIDEGEEPEEVIVVLGPKPQLPPGTCDTAFQQQSQREQSQAVLYKISDATGDMKVTLVAGRTPFQQELLKQDECYILDDKAHKKVFVWKGKNATVQEREAARQIADQFIKDRKYSSRTQIEIMPGGAESTLFKEYFSNWMDEGEITGMGPTCTGGNIARVQQIPFDASTLHDNNAMAAQHGMIDDGSGTVQIWRVEGGDKVPVDPSTYGHFYGGDCYLVLYSYDSDGQKKHIIYTWQGKKCSRDELGHSALLTVHLDDSMGGIPTQVRVTQSQEPAHLVSLFKGNPMVVHLGGTSRKGGQSEAAETRLFHIRMSSIGAVRAVEVEACASALNSNDIFVLKSGGEVTLWRGKSSMEEEMDAAQYLANSLGGSVTEINEGKEPESFWDALGGKKNYQTSKALLNVMSAPRLFACSNKTGRLIAEEVPGEPTQLDLAPDDIMLLDTGDQIFVWIGKEANEVEKSGADDIAINYINTDPSGRSGIPITTIKQGQEPPTFTGWFHAWDKSMWSKDMKDLISLFGGR